MTVRSLWTSATRSVGLRDVVWKKRPRCSKERYAPRSGIESTNSGLKNRLGLGRLRVRGRGSVFRVLLHKIAGWNVLRAAASAKLRAWVKTKVAATLKSGESGPTARPFALVLGLWNAIPLVLGVPQGRSLWFSASLAA